MEFQDDVVGGVTLIRPAIQSPDYVAGTSGWSINVDGSAEFNDITIRGGETIGSDFLIYNGTPAAGNLILSISGDGGTDQFGNLYGPGLQTFGSRVGLDYISSIASGEIFLARPGMTDPAFISYNDLGNGQYELFLDSGFANGAGSASGSFISLVSSKNETALDGEITLNSPSVAVNGSLSVASTDWQTYTPVVTGAGSAVFGVRTGWFYKLGSLVYFEAYITVTTAGTGTDVVTVTMPSEPYRGGGLHRQKISAYMGGVLAGSNSSTPGSFMCVILAGGTGAMVDQMRGPTDTVLRGTNLGTATIFTISGWYRENV